MSKITDAVKAALTECGYSVDGVSYSCDETDIGRLNHRVESRVSAVAIGKGDASPIGVGGTPIEGVDPVTGRECYALMVSLSTYLDSHRGFVTTFDFSTVLGEPSDG